MSEFPENKIYSPANIEILLWSHTRVDPHPTWQSPHYAACIQELVAMGVVKADTENPKCYKTTPLGTAWVECLCDVKLPTLAYVSEHGKVICPPK